MDEHYKNIFVESPSARQRQTAYYTASEYTKHLISLTDKLKRKNRIRKIKKILIYITLNDNITREI